jgi:glycosyltransferase involved in cell wall biosynthesis
MRIVYMTDSLRAGGKERQSVALLKGLAERGVESLVVSMGSDRFFEPSLRESVVRIEYLERKQRWDLGVFIQLDRLIRGFRPDLLHTNCWMTSFYAWPLGKLHAIPLVNGSIRNAFAQDGIRWQIERILLKLSDARIGNSRAGFLSRGFRLDARGNYVVYNGYDFARITQPDPQIVKMMNDLAQGNRIVGMVAQFKDDKDYSTYFEAARRILQKRSDVVFVAVGGGKNLEALRQRYSAYSPSIQFLGLQTAIESIVSTFSIGVLATYTEGLSNAIMEYMALGKPVVATDGGGTVEIVVDGVTGFLVPPRQPQILADKIERLLDSPELAASFGKAGEQRLRGLFSIRQLIDRTWESYRAVLSGDY